LNSNIMAYYMGMLQDQNENEYWRLTSKDKQALRFKRVLVLKDDFVNKLLSSVHEISPNEIQINPAIVDHCTKQYFGKNHLVFDVFQKILVVNYNDSRWNLFEIDCTMKDRFNFTIFDSLKSNDDFDVRQDKVVGILHKWVEYEIDKKLIDLYGNSLSQNVKNVYLERLRRSEFRVARVPTETQASDSGLFVCKFAESLMMGKDMNFGQTEIDELRQKLVDLCRDDYGSFAI